MVLIDRHNVEKPSNLHLEIPFGLRLDKSRSITAIQWSIHMFPFSLLKNRAQSTDRYNVHNFNSKASMKMLQFQLWNLLSLGMRRSGIIRRRIPTGTGQSASFRLRRRLWHLCSAKSSLASS